MRNWSTSANGSAELVHPDAKAVCIRRDFKQRVVRHRPTKLIAPMPRPYALSLTLPEPKPEPKLTFGRGNGCGNGCCW